MRTIDTVSPGAVNLTVVKKVELVGGFQVVEEGRVVVQVGSMSKNSPKSITTSILGLAPSRALRLRKMVVTCTLSHFNSALRKSSHTDP